MAKIAQCEPGLKHNQNKKVKCKHVNRIELARSDYNFDWIVRGGLFLL